MSQDVNYETALNLVYLPDGRVVNQTNEDPAIERVTGHQNYWVAADLGQSNDYTAVVVIKDEALPVVDADKVIVGPRHRSIVYADRFRGVSYVDVCDHLIRLRNAPPFGGKSELVIDGTSLGRVVSDMLWDQSVDHHAVQMTGGQSWRKESSRYVNAGKTFMIENLSVLFASGDLKFAHDLPLRDEIESDLASFSLQTTAAGNQIITQSRSAGGHGDLGIAVIVGAFASQYLRPKMVTTHTLRGWY
ncbi:hypothetical protein C357_00974 [Citreicella sp. 357]|nr:hypothetical protein C357_00974 [Citreicella sp. 357]